ncbi:MAG TPA: flagellar hook-basal body complex protein FliE [Acetobacteraceae bacterium]|nr:flagellar hook-basal body complex protein FliE [Acetobacteraceae bacterium]
MSTIPTLVVTPAGAADAYGKVASGASDPAAAAGSGFGATLQRAIEGLVETGQKADALSAQAITGQGNLTEVVAAVSQAELTLQTTAAIRDRVVQAYQSIMSMPI